MFTCPIFPFVCRLSSLPPAEGYLYAKSHEWASLDGNMATIGISNYAQVWQLETHYHFYIAYSFDVRLSQVIVFLFVPCSYMYISRLEVPEQAGTGWDMYP